MAYEVVENTISFQCDVHLCPEYEVGVGIQANCCTEYGGDFDVYT